ncbi:adenine deaminase [Methylotetracoccus oryzae]|uniref:adenine deaminase n=1 Tax=Methylotetracoccus oryzae TaxID=1919059 RepID=UPI00111979B3|nr:adenine deaminase [Methylotetracoccus oryzae]
MAAVTESAPRVSATEGVVVANLVQIEQRRVIAAEIHWRAGVIHRIRSLGGERSGLGYVMPGFVDAHLHIESSLLTPAAFARMAVRHGTVGAICDPHEIANVLGTDGVRFMLREARETPFHFLFGAPSCVPATPFVTTGAELDVAAVEALLLQPGVGFLSEVMNVPAVLARDPALCAKIGSARRLGLPVDGHAPGLRGDGLRRYVAAGIDTDHECATLEEALEKIRCGMHILIREGSAARNFDALHPLLTSHTERVMLCSDDKHPDALLDGHIDRMVARAVALGHEVFDVLRAACINPVRHYRLPGGLLRVGDAMDAIEVSDLASFVARRTWLRGVCVWDGSVRAPQAVIGAPINRFDANPIAPEALVLAAPEGRLLRVIEVRDGELITRELRLPLNRAGQGILPDPGRDILLLAVMNRYHAHPPAVALVRGFGLRAGALASSVAHDAHNVIAVGTDAQSLCAAANAVIAARGGLAVALRGRVELLPLPVAGLMSREPGEKVAERYASLERLARRLGCPLQAPLMALSFLTLLVIPELKLSDRGLFDTTALRFTSPWV